MAGVVATALALPVAAIAGGSAAGAAPAGVNALTPATASSAVAPARLPLPKLKGKVGPGFTISVSPKSITAGKYKVIVNDAGTIHNWHITGPGGVDKATSVPGTGKTVWKITFVKGTYAIVCDPHKDSMKTSLTVT